MPSARWKLKSQPLDLHGPDPWNTFSDIEVNQCSPHLCAICEHAGQLVICDGPCHRQFHFKRSGQEAPTSCCPHVCILEDSGDPWRCLDCTTSRAKCFQCGTVGVMQSEVRKCLATYCVCWYCRLCFPMERSTCDLHVCDACDGPFQIESLQDAMQCLRCPTSWNLSCLKNIQCKDVSQTRWGVDRPPWKHEAHGQTRWMVYCQDHALDCTLGTPAHNHIA